MRRNQFTATKGLSQGNMKILKPVYLFAALFCCDLPAQAQACAAPLPPFVPVDPADIRIYAELVKADVEKYFDDVERYFRCQDQKRRKVFEQARQVGDEYGRVLETLDGDR